MIRFEKLTYTYPFQEEPAVKDICFHVKKGQVVLITGASGSGKSTLIRLMNGLCPHFFQGTLTGQIFHDGKPSADKTLQEMSSLVGTVFQNPENSFFALNVEEELAFAHECQGKEPETIKEIVCAAAGQLGITSILDASIHDLSQGQKQKVALGAVLSMNPSIVVLDEPTANLDPESTTELGQLILELKSRGMTIIIADHRLYWLENIIDQVVVMNQGQIAATGDFSILAEQDLAQTCGLRSCRVSDCRHTLKGLPDTGHIEVKNLTFGYNGHGPTGSIHDQTQSETKNESNAASYKNSHIKGQPLLYEDVSFALPKGVTGIIGDNGTGKTTLARILTGLTKIKQGNFFIDKVPVSPKKMLGRAAIVLQNTDHQLHMNSVIQEIFMSSGKKGSWKKHETELLEVLNRFGLAPLAHRHPQSLSGGEKQRLVIACGLASKPDIFILDEPTSGLDGNNMRRIAKMIRSAATEQGMSILVITHDLELLEIACDRALRLPFHNNNKGEKNTI